MRNNTTKYKTPHIFNSSLYISSWAVFAVSLTLYWITADPGVSYWDCPEYVVTASKMEIGHPPGNPVWMLAMRMATIPFAPQHHAYIINLCSGLFMAFASFFLCRVIYVAVRAYFFSSKSRNSIPSVNADYISGIVAAGASLCFALCDSAWFSAVEAEVYAMSAFLSALSLWIMVLWWWEKSRSRRSRLLILLAYITGLSLGVHQLNLLLIPVYALIIFYKRHPRRSNPLKSLLIVIISFAIVGGILLGLLPALFYGAKSFELFGVNILGLPYNSGVIFFCLILMAFFIILLLFSRFYPADTYRLSTGIWMGAFLILGFSSIGIIMIRGMAAPPMNEGAPDNIFSLSSYFEREQYPSTPLIYGSTPYSQPMLKEEFIDGKPNYSRYILVKGEKKFTPYLEGAVLNHRSGMTTSDDTLLNQRVESKGHGYLLSDYNFKQKLTPELDMWFPRITSRKGADISAYSDWAGMTVDNMQKLNISETIDSAGNFQPRAQMWGFRQPVYSYRPTYVQNLRYFRNYQVYYMYLRYLFWNFIGRQNDMPSTGEIEHGNFVTGIPPIDSYWLGVTSDTPSEIWSENKGSNRYFGIPFIIGIIGLLWLISGNLKKRRCFYLVSLIFLMTGLAIVVYLNQTPGEPRERDYTFLGSYMAFVMWIGAGLTGILRLLPFFLTKKTGLIFSTLISFAPATLMAVENFDDHDRRGRFEPEFYASSILDFEEPAIIFTHGDNSTFPIWYASEVIGSGKNHTPIDVTYLSLPSYVINLKKQGDKGISTIGSSPQLAFGGYLLSRIPADSVSEALPIDLSLSHLYSSQANYPVFPSAAVKVPKSNRDSATIHLREFSGGSSYLQFRHLMLLDIIASQLKSEKSKVIFFPSSIEHGFYKPLDNLLQPALFGKIYAPGLQDDEITALLKKSLEQELKKLNELLANRPDLASHYMDQVIADMSVRYRGEMLLAAGELMARGDTISAINTVDVLAKAFPYHKLLPGNFTLGDSTFYEGVEFRNLTAKIYDATQNIRYRDLSNSVDSIINSRHIQWLKYYHSLPPEQRKYLSNRSKRLLIKPNL